MIERDFGSTGLRVSAMGLGTGALGDSALAERDVARLLDAALELGVTFIDSAPSYGLAEERIGRHLADRRGRFLLSTKCGYGTPGIPDWTGPCIAAGVDAALGRLRTDVIDVLHLHSCPREVLLRDEILEALEAARRAGKVRVAAYSGENEDLAAAIGVPTFGSIQASVNLCDQRALGDLVPRAVERGLGVVAKRPLANAPWRYAERPEAPDVATYWERLRALDLDPAPLAWDELALRFAAFAPGVSTVVLGTRSVENLTRNAEAVARGPLPAELLERVARSFERAGGAAWPGLI